MSAIYKNGQFYANGIEENKTVTSAEFTAMSQAQKDNGTAWYVEDGEVVSNFTVLGNRFDKANIYTADEKMIGSYMGKPLYQKTLDPYTLSGITDGTSKTFTIDTGLTSSNIEKILLSKAFIITSTGWTNMLNQSWGNNDVFATIDNSGTTATINLACNRASFNNSNAYLTVQYTKTSDGQVSIGTGNDYSTDEQIIGTWIDGKRLYQKVITVNGTFSTMDAEVVDTSSLNIEELVDLRTIDHSHFGQAKFAIIPFSHPEDDWSMAVYINNSNKICVCPGRYMSLVNPIFILQYTKTTD